MKIFCRCSKTRVAFAIVFAIFATFIASLLSISNTYAAATVTGGIFTGAGDVRWEWQRSFDSDSEDEKVVIKFYDRPENLAEVTVPSLADVISASGATATLNTYFLDSADTDQQDAIYSATYPKRTETAKVTKLDMSNTSKIQILGVAPILDPETEAELIFGENMVIGDSATINKHVEMKLCNEYYNWGDVYVCSVDYFNVTPADVDPSMVAGWEDMSLAERYAYQPTPEDLGYSSTDEYSSIPASEYDPSLTYLSPREITTTTEVVDHGAFSGYKLKLTNLDNVKYIGWYAFKDSTFNAVNLEITIEENQTTGQSAFENTNIEKAVLKNTETSVDMFKDCANLSEVEFVNTEIIRDGSFENTTVGPSLDLSNTNVKKVLSRAFKNTGLTEINIEGVEKLGAEAFANNDIKEVYFPKSINDLSESSVFFGNNNLTKLTVAFDTLTSGTTNAFFSIIGDGVASESDTYVAGQIKELELIAPYGENESVSATHLSYMDYITNHYTGSAENSENTQRLRNDSAYKNIVAPGYFYGFYNVEKLTIGDGYEMVGAQSFFGYGVKSGIITGAYLIDQFKSTIDEGYYTALKNVSLPDTLKAIDFYGFGFHSNPEDKGLRTPRTRLIHLRGRRPSRSGS